LGDPGGFNNVDITKEEKGDEVDHTIEHWLDHHAEASIL
jgi:hypothetical protein